jgi:hypothetical protein
MYSQDFKGHVTIIPRPTVKDYKGMVSDPTPAEYIIAIQETYVETLRKIGLIRSLYGIEREFDRYYSRLQVKCSREKHEPEKEKIQLEGIFMQSECLHTEVMRRSKTKPFSLPKIEQTANLVDDSMKLGLVSDLGFAAKESNSDASSQRGLAFKRSNRKGHSFLKAGNRFVRVPS